MRPMTASSPSADSMEAIRADIRAAGLRATSARISVLRVLRTRARPMSHAEVAEALSDQAWDKATVYRNLVDLARAGLLRRAVLGDRLWRFEEVTEDDHEALSHSHFVCVKCGMVECLPEDAVTVGRGTYPGLPAEFEVQLRGECADCGVS